MDFVAEEKEVERILQIPLKEFLSFQNRKFTDLKVRGHILKNVPYFDIEGEILWGATSMIMSELVRILDDMNINEHHLKL